MVGVSLSKNRNHTIVVLSTTTIARIDLRVADGIDVVGAWEGQRSPDAELPQAFLEALDLASHDATVVHLLSDEFWTGTVTLSAEVVAAVEEQQIDQAIALEIEYESGVPAFESQLTKFPLQPDGVGVKTWRVLQASNATLESLRACLPLWNGRTIHLGAIPTDAAEAGNGNDLNQCIGWASAWLELFLAGREGRLTLDVQRPLWNQRRQTMLTGVLALSAIVGCWSHHRSLNTELTRGKQELRSIAEQKKTVAGKLKQHELRQADRAKHQSEQADRIRQQMNDAALRSQHARIREDRRQRPGELLRGLNFTAHEDHWISKIQFDLSGAVVSGVAADSGAIGRLTTQLHGELASSRWQVMPAAMSLGDFGLVRFEIFLQPHSVDKPQGPKTVAKTGDENVL